MYPQVFGKYVLEGEIARGGMARLMLATLRGAGGFEKKLVVKQIRDELASDETFVKRFVEEAKTTVALSHPNIVPVYELGVEQGTYFLAMELVEGVSIAELLDSGVLSPEEGAYVGAEVCRALDYAHRRMQVVHRDITPRNVMVDEEGQVKLIDFGIAALAAQKGSKQVFGSPGHMPPEQMEGKPLGPPADLFALGALLMESWSKKAPFRRKTAQEIETALSAPRPKPSEIDARLLPLDEIMEKVLASDPKERPQEADELGRAFRKFLSGTDMGDIARALGARVRERRAAIRAKKDAPPASAGGLQRPASRGEMITKTFAARDEVAQVPISTRKLVSQPPPSALEAPDQVRVETIATRPIETPAKSAPPARSTGRFALAALAVVVAIGGAWWLRAQRVPASDPGTATATVTATATAPATVAVPGTVTVTVTATVTGPASASGEARTVAHLSLFGDPGTRAFVDGTARGSCPVNDVPVAPGEHDVRFVFDATGESAGTRVQLKANERLKLRSDFTAATPAVHVQR